jgi:hypothetical protein
VDAANVRRVDPTVHRLAAVALDRPPLPPVSARAKACDAVRACTGA